ncbi:hypothetical protein BJX70DRAFT_330572 [Aspergillus crustosus]
MDLPPEIRNQIYSYLFHPHRVQIKRRKLTTPRPQYRLSHEQLAPRDPKTQSLACRPHKSQSQYSTQLALPFVSRQSYIDTICLLYACTQFVFATPKCLSRFLEKTPKQTRQVIQQIEISHTMYNEPHLYKNREFKLRGDRNWYSLCERVVTNFTALKAVYVDLEVFDCLIRLEVGEAWSLPVLAFRRVKGQKSNGCESSGLDFAKIRLRSRQFPRGEVSRVEKQLEKEVMGPVAVQVAEDEKKARILANLKATKVLSLVFN